MAKKEERFVRTWSDGVFGSNEIWVDRKTGVNYLWHASGYAGGLTVLVDREGKKALERPVAHMNTESLIISELLNDPSALVSPIVRNGSKATVGANEAVWKDWVAQG